MKRSKIEFDSVWKAAIHDLLVREHYTNTKLESQIEGLNNEVINLMKSDAVKDDQIDDHERRLKKREEIVGLHNSRGVQIVTPNAGGKRNE